MFTFESRRDGWRIVGLGVASFLAIFPLCAWRHLEIIESDILERSQKVLTESGISGVEIALDGRDLSLTSAGGDPDLKKAADALRDLYGVRKVVIPGEDAPGAGDG